MKEIIPKIYKLETQEERLNFFENLWSTDLFKIFIRSENPVVQMIKRNYIKYPRYYYYMQDRDKERAAFTSWYNVLSLKKYENSYIQDLYYFHELTHIATMTYEPDLDFKSWCIKMRNNEVLASMNSEVLIYFYIPEYRQYTFKEEIWVDRFLNKDYYKSLANQDLAQLAIDLTSKRANAYENPKDAVEQILSDFRQFSHLYYNVWKKHYVELETVLRNFYKGDVVGFETFLQKNQSKSGILFKDKVEKHQKNYIKRNKLRPNY